MVRGAGCRCRALVPHSPRLPLLCGARYLPLRCCGWVCIPCSPRIREFCARIFHIRHLRALEARAGAPCVCPPHPRRVRVRGGLRAVVGYLVPRLASARSLHSLPRSSCSLPLSPLPCMRSVLPRLLRLVSPLGSLSSHSSCTPLFSSPCSHL